MATKPLLSVDSVAVEFRTRNGIVKAVRDVSFTVEKGRTLGIVGESGSGKSVTSYAVMRILDRAAHLAGGRIDFGGLDLRDASESAMTDIRGREISMVFQNPRSALNPTRPVGRQIEDVLIRHAQATRANVRERAIEALAKVRIRDPEKRYHAYPFELSGGMCQRVVIALALACRPQLLIADEPTTGLDVTTQRAVMDLIRELIRAESMSLILITHDLGLAGEYCDDIVVMEKGLVVEARPAGQLFTAPSHPYTRRLIRSTPHGAHRVEDLLPEPANCDPGQIPATDPAPGPLPATEPGTVLLEVNELGKHYPQPRTWKSLFSRATEPRLVHRAVDDISFRVMAGESVGLVGESGCGKSTTSSMLMRLLEPTHGSIRFRGQELTLTRRADFTRSPLRRELQMVFQDPTESLNPRASAFESIADPLVGLAGFDRGQALRSRVEELAAQVGLPLELLDRLPHQLSGGQKARVGIARAIATRPSLLVLDEPTAALDVSVQAIVLNLLASLRRSCQMSYLFVSHDLEVVRLMCDRVIVMRAGRIVEQGPTHEVLSRPVDPYTRELIAAVPRPTFADRTD
jgi:peptide/nickel transport system ATP-binding protein